MTAEEKAHSPEILLNGITRFIADTRAFLKAGALTELAGMDNQVRLLCEEVLLLSQEDRARYAEGLQRLLADLTALAKELAEQREEVAEEIRGISDHKKASVAYRTVEASGGKEE